MFLLVASFHTSVGRLALCASFIFVKGFFVALSSSDLRFAALSGSLLCSLTLCLLYVAGQRLSFARPAFGCPRSAYVEIGNVSTEPNL